jgi:hypothetical protein
MNYIGSWISAVCKLIIRADELRDEFAERCSYVLPVAINEDVANSGLKTEPFQDNAGSQMDHTNSMDISRL